MKYFRPFLAIALVFALFIYDSRPVVDVGSSDARGFLTLCAKGLIFGSSANKSFQNKVECSVSLIIDRMTSSGGGAMCRRSEKNSFLVKCLLAVVGIAIALSSLSAPGKAEGAILPVSLSVQGIGVDVFSGQSSVLGTTDTYSGLGLGGGAMVELNLPGPLSLRAQANYIHFSGTPVFNILPITGGVQMDLFSLLPFTVYIAGDAGYNESTGLGTSGGNFTWDAGVGVSFGPVYVEGRYTYIAGPIMSTSQGSMGPMSYIPIVVGFTFF